MQKTVLYPLFNFFLSFSNSFTSYSDCNAQYFEYRNDSRDRGIDWYCCYCCYWCWFNGVDPKKMEVFISSTVFVTLQYLNKNYGKSNWIIHL